MTSENTLTGQTGDFQVGNRLIARTKQWAVSPKLASSSEWGDSDSKGYTNRAPGRKDATFTGEGVYQTNNEVYDFFQPGDILNATLWMNNVNLYWQFPRAMNTEFSLTVNIDTSEVIGWTSSWGADGIYYRPGQADAPAVAFPT